MSYFQEFEEVIPVAFLSQHVLPSLRALHMPRALCHECPPPSPNYQPLSPLARICNLYEVFPALFKLPVTNSSILLIYFRKNPLKVCTYLPTSSLG